MAEKKKSGIKPKLQKAKAKFFATYYSDPAKDIKIIAVTGDKGRDITAHFLQNILKNRDAKTGLIIDPKSTSDLYKQLYKIWRTGADHAVISIDSNGLANHFFYGLPIHIAIITDNTEPKTPSSILPSTNPEEAKAILFNTQPYFSILNRDDANYDLFAKYPTKTATFTYGHSADADLCINRFKLYPTAIEANVTYSGQKFDLASYATGEEATHYMAAAALAGFALDFDRDTIVDGIADYEPNTK
ncbi:MAG: Mur ligase family protein [Candidatus Saccharibacteria bacterium]|nr:Mur ligase family protein [Candidatus Saccharibacteria bacterium]